MKIRDNIAFFTFALSLFTLFLHRFYDERFVRIIIHLTDLLIFIFILAETFLPAKEEKYIRKYFQKNAVSCILTLIFCTVFVYLKLKIIFVNNPQELNLIFSLFKNIFLAAKVIQKIKQNSGLTKKLISNPARTLIISFLMVIIIGCFLLMLPAASAKQRPLDFLTALFTAASAVCVTGLSTIDISTELSVIGKFILISLIQIGGLGIMVFSFFGMLAFRKKLSVADKITVSYMVSEDDMSGLFKALRVIIFSTFLIETISALFLFIAFSKKIGFGIKALGFSFFHSVSAFCNAGFALFSNNLESFTADSLINFTIGFTIILGGISFAVIYDITGKMTSILKNIFFKKKTAPYFLSFNAKIILTMTLILLLISFILFYLLEHTNTMKDFCLGKQYLAAFFQAVTLRTAGFSTISFSSLRNSTLLFMIFIMFIGGASGSTAGGIKLSTVAVVTAFFKSFLQNTDAVVIKKMTIPEEQVKKSFLIFGFGLCVIFTGIFLLTVTEDIPFLPIAFETVSAFATVGLSTGITGLLSSAGKVVIICLMFIGRVGPLTILTAAGKKRRDNAIEYPYGNIAVG